MNIVEARRRARNTRPSRVIDTDYFSLGGGLNLVATPLEIHPGELIDVSNYEIGPDGGYTRVGGYERLDGQVAPSEAQFWLVEFDSGSSADYPAAGTLINGETSGATGVVLTAVVESAAGVGYVVVGRLAGAFQAAENLRVVTTVFGVSTTASIAAAPTATLSTVYRRLAEADARAQIAEVPGSGPVRGVAVYRGKVYAVRDNPGATAAGFYVEGASGWTAIPDYPLLRFNTGTVEILPGQTITGGTSAHTAEVRRVVLKSGSWSGGTAAGYLILTSATGTFTDTEALNVSAAPVAVADGTAAAPARPPGGTYEFRVHNFYGHTATERLYGVNGVGNAFEIQDGAGAFYCPIETGMTNDKPDHLAVYKARLWLSFSGGSVQNSGVADPVVFTVVTGASEFGIGESITGFLEEVSNALFVFGRNRTNVITHDGSNFQLDTFAKETGALPWTIQRIGRGIFLDDRGIATLASSERFGNFASSSVSERINPLLAQMLAGSACSVVGRRRNVYRHFLTDGRFVSVGFRNDQISGFTMCNLGLAMNCAFSGEDPDGGEYTVAGGTNGFVYRLDSGRNFDGLSISAYARLAYHYSKAPTRMKQYRAAILDVLFADVATLKMEPKYNDGYIDTGESESIELARNYTGSLFGSATWDAATWMDALPSLPNGTFFMKLDCEGRNIGLLVSSASSDELPHVLRGVNLQYSYRRVIREAEFMA